MILEFMYWLAVSIIAFITLSCAVFTVLLIKLTLEDRIVAAYTCTVLATNFLVDVLPVGGVALVVALILR